MMAAINSESHSARAILPPKLPTQQRAFSTLVISPMRRRRAKDAGPFGPRVGLTEEAVHRQNGNLKHVPAPAHDNAEGGVGIVAEEIETCRDVGDVRPQPVFVNVSGMMIEMKHLDTCWIVAPRIEGPLREAHEVLEGAGKLAEADVERSHPDKMIYLVGPSL